MTTISDMLDSFKRLNLRKQVPIIIEQTKEEIITLNQRQLYNNSEDAKGVPLRFYASNSYAFEKERRNPNPGFGRPDLFLSGAFYRGFYISVTNSTYDIYSRDSKTGKLVAKYGEDIFGMTDDSQQQYVEETLYNGLSKYIEQITGV